MSSRAIAYVSEALILLRSERATGAGGKPRRWAMGLGLREDARGAGMDNLVTCLLLYIRSTHA
ncbi:MAG: hypothetical protein FWH57_10115 [Oscillospiraceae bacterium]|nr:hypothetical protein [Oscillospiraceae bacterium]